MSAAKALIEDIFKMHNMSTSKLASNIGVKPSTLTRIINEQTEMGSFKTYMKLLEYKGKLGKNDLVTRRAEK
jgi:plasmid maintenance system antidote protein VapI